MDEPIYLEHDRKSLVLETLANVVPMSTETGEAFRRANDEGYFAFNALLLAHNGSPVALELFRSMMADKAVDSEARVELLHQAICPTAPSWRSFRWLGHPGRRPRRAGCDSRDRIRVRLSDGMVPDPRASAPGVADGFRR